MDAQILFGSLSGGGFAALLTAAKTADELASREPKKCDARIAILFVYRRIILRRNREERPHIELADALNALMRVETVTPEAASVDAMVDLARRVLKREWEVAKLGPLAKPVMWWRERRGAIDD